MPKTSKKKTTKKKEEKEKLVLPERYRIIAVDSSYLRPGFAIFEIEDGAIRSVGLSNVNNKTNENGKIVKTQKPRGEILDEILYHFSHIYEEDEVPTYFVREKAFNSRGSQYEIAIFEVLAVLDWVVWRLHNVWYELYPVTIKKAITGNHMADKDAVANSLIHYVGTLPYACDDESDAVAVGIAWMLQNDAIKPYVAPTEENNTERSDQNSKQ